MARVAAMLRESSTLSLAQRQPVQRSLHSAISRESCRLAGYPRAQGTTRRRPIPPQRAPSR